jgi:methyl-galactoside transport system substrate-binding protein
MKFLKKLLSFIIISSLFLSDIGNISYASLNQNDNKPIKAAVFLNNLNDLFISDVKKSLEDVQKENESSLCQLFVIGIKSVQKLL